jgi:hypothetical protein
MATRSDELRALFHSAPTAGTLWWVLSYSTHLLPLPDYDERSSRGQRLGRPERNGRDTVVELASVARRQGRTSRRKKPVRPPRLLTNQPHPVLLPQLEHV